MSIERPTPQKETVAAKESRSEQKQTHESLPELELTELLKSEKPINEVENKKLKIEAVRPWNNYTIVTLEGSDEIRLILMS